MKPDQSGGDGKGVKQSEMFNYFVYSRLGNNVYCFQKYGTLSTSYYQLPTLSVSLRFLLSVAQNKPHSEQFSLDWLTVKPVEAQSKFILLGVSRRYF